jgi:hypothetical protein
VGEAAAVEVRVAVSVGKLGVGDGWVAVGEGEGGVAVSFGKLGVEDGAVAVASGRVAVVGKAVGTGTPPVCPLHATNSPLTSSRWTYHVPRIVSRRRPASIKEL